VLVGGCHPGDCHYQEGNYKARRRMAILEESLAATGLDAERVWLRWISASEGGKFAETITQFTTRLKALGPNPAKELWML
jgi:F420-non-reducing hydrogenase iron-sulfur subunit